MNLSINDDDDDDNDDNDDDDNDDTSSRLWTYVHFRVLIINKILNKASFTS